MNSGRLGQCGIRIKRQQNQRILRFHGGLSSRHGKVGARTTDRAPSAKALIPAFLQVFLH
jgi:hypothetical protein